MMEIWISIVSHSRYVSIFFQHENNVFFSVANMGGYLWIPWELMVIFFHVFLGFRTNNQPTTNQQLFKMNNWFQWLSNQPRINYSTNQQWLINQWGKPWISEWFLGLSFPIEPTTRFHGLKMDPDDRGSPQKKSYACIMCLYSHV